MKLSVSKLPIAILLLSFLFLSNSVTANDKKAPQFELKDLNGKTVKLSDFKGKVVFINFWATWCGPCRKEIPDFIDMQKTYEKKGFTFIGIALDDYKSVVKYSKDNKINYPILMGTQETTRLYGGIRGIPTSFLVGKDGNIKQQYVGYRPKNVFEKDIKELINKK